MKTICKLFLSMALITMSFISNTQVIEGVNINQNSNVVNSFFGNNPWAIGILIALTFIYFLRVVIIDTMFSTWNRKLEHYIAHGVYSECLSHEQEQLLRASFLYGSINDYVSLRKSRIEHFIENEKLIQDIEDYYEAVRTQY